MAPVSSHVSARDPTARGALKSPWQRLATPLGGDSTAYGGSPWSPAFAFFTIGGIVLLCVFWGFAVVVAELNALIFGLVLLACVLILFDFRVGVVLLIVLMPLSASRIFPHEIAGVTGLNPVNLLLAGTLGSYLLHALSKPGIARLIPRPLLWLYIVPFLIAGAWGAQHVGEIPLLFFVTEQLKFTDAVGYLRDMVAKPLFLVVFSLLVSAAVARTGDSKKFLAPAIISVWVMGLLSVVYFLLSGRSFDALASSTERAFLSPLGLHANDLGRIYAVAYALLLFTWSGTKDHGLKLILLASMALVVMALALTFSRSGFVAFALVTVLFLLSRRSVMGLLCGLLLAATALLFIPESIYERMMYGFGAGADAISAGRIGSIWLPLMPEVLRNPLYGNGISSMLWSEAVRGGRSLLTGDPHNAYLRTVMDMGIIGLVLVCAYFVHVWRGFRRLGLDPDLSAAQRGFYQGAAAALVSLLAVGMAGGSLTPGPDQVFLWLAIGMMYGERAGRPGT